MWLTSACGSQLISRWAVHHRDGRDATVTDEFPQVGVYRLGGNGVEAAIHTGVDFGNNLLNCVETGGEGGDDLPLALLAVRDVLGDLRARVVNRRAVTGQDAAQVERQQRRERLQILVQFAIAP